MKVTIIGGGLQGVESAYLARHAGWHVTVLDRKSAPPARGLCNRFIQSDIVTDDMISKVFAESDLVLPAMENSEALNALMEIARSNTTPLAFDPHAYAVTSSKERSNNLFARLGMPLPTVGRHSRGPVIVKPNNGSGSRGVKIFESYAEARMYMDENNGEEHWICQKYLPGPSYSIEVIGMPGNYRTFAVTDLFMDESYDCRRVCAPSNLGFRLQGHLANMARQLAQALSLKGIMDVEVIEHGGRLYLLEIDARIPSQTPTAVFKATGVNMIAILGALFTRGEMPTLGTSASSSGGVLYEHIKVGAGGIRSCGEHIMAQAGPLELVSNFFGCDEAITNYRYGSDEWAATLICSGDGPMDAMQKRDTVFDRIWDVLKQLNPMVA